MPHTSEPLDCQRALFSIPTGHCYLNSAFMGPLPRAVEQAGMMALRARAAPIGSSPLDFFEPAERTRTLCGALVNADPERIAFVPTVAYATAIVAKNLRPKAGQNIVVLGDMFPSNIYAWRQWQGQGVEVRSVTAPDAPWSSPLPAASRAARWNEGVVAAIDAGTALVAVEPAHWIDGTLFDLDRIGRRCREVGAAFVVDATQTAGAMPLDARHLQADALVVHSYKSMLSNYGLGFLVLGERFLDASPLEESWLTRAGSDDFARLVDYRDGYAPGMRRFDTGLRANPCLIGMLEAACRLLIDWQPGRVREYLLRIARPAVARMRAMGFEVADDAERCANLFGVKLPPGMEPELCRQHLTRLKIHVAVRGASVRVSPHVYNDERDLEKLTNALASMRPTEG